MIYLMMYFIVGFGLSCITMDKAFQIYCNSLNDNEQLTFIEEHINLICFAYVGLFTLCWLPSIMVNLIKSNQL
jgi:hypothetical protein